MLSYILTKPSQFKAYLDQKIQDPKSQRISLRQQRKLVLLVVCIALLLDNMLYMVIVPIIPEYLSEKDAKTTRTAVKPTPSPFSDLNKNSDNVTYSNKTLTKTIKITRWRFYYNKAGDPEEGKAIGWLFAIKAIVQLCVNPISGSIIDRVGYDRPMMFGLFVIFVSTTAFAFGESYFVLFTARGLQGVGSAFADTGGLAMIADRFTEDKERSAALGIALAFISFGSLVAPPFGGILYQLWGKYPPFLSLAFIAVLDGMLMMMVMQPVRAERAVKKQHEALPDPTPIYRLLIDPYIAVTAGCLVMANVSLAFLEPTISLWMKETMNAEEWQMGLIWFPPFFPHVAGVYTTVKLSNWYPRHLWLIGAIGLVLEGASCIVIPLCRSFYVLIIPLSILCFGIAMVDTALLPTLGYLVDTRYVPVYGSVYAIADISYSIAYALGPILAGQIVAAISFDFLNLMIFLSNIIYAPLMFFLWRVYKYKPMREGETSDKEAQADDEAEALDGPNRPVAYGGTDAEGDTCLNGDATVWHEEKTAFHDQETRWDGVGGIVSNNSDETPSHYGYQ